MTNITERYTVTDGIYTCKECGKTTTYASTMHYHIASRHIKEKPYNCSDCKKGFVQRSLYEKHLAVAHSDTTRNRYVGVYYQCSGCSHTSTTKGNCLIHYTRTHASWIPAYKKDSECTGCKKIFTSSTAYLYHAINCFPIPELISVANTAPRALPLL